MMITKNQDFVQEMQGIHYTAETLKISDQSRLKMIHDTYNKHGVDTSVLPTFVALEPYQSARDLLKQHNVNISTQKFNKLMIDAGYMEILPRPSKSNPNKIKKIKILTDLGMEYGQNDVTHHAPYNSQPHYFCNKFSELLVKLELI